LEDLYLPFKKKTKTKATVAKENGLEPLAELITRQNSNDVQKEAKKYLTKNVKSIEDALLGARHIIAEWINENPKARDICRNLFSRKAFIESKVVTKKKEEAIKYKDYFQFNEMLNRIPSHRLLAILRAEKEGFLKVKVSIDEEELYAKLERLLINGRNACAKQIQSAIEDCGDRLLLPSMSNEFRKSAKLKADEEAIAVFSENLKQLLLAAPLGEQNIMALDPGFRTGCKLVCLDQNGSLVFKSTIFPHPPQNQEEESYQIIRRCIDKYKIKAVAIGNGTAGKESFALFSKFNLDKAVDVFMVNESGASIYSASAIAREEFPDLDLTVRGAISIGRRLQDPLAELVKIDAKSIGVGQYQHDVNQTLLKNSLDRAVESAVNSVGVNLNTASKHLMTYVSGLGPVLAQNIINYRNENGPFKSRKEISKVPRMGKKAFEQSAGFLRIRDAKNPLDNTAVHPERYKLVDQIAKQQKLKTIDLITKPEARKNINLQAFISSDIGLPTLKDILKELEKPGLDPRGHAKAVSFDKNISTIEDLEPGKVLTGVVNNLTKFGAFVDIGIKESGLVHISQITNKFIKDPAEVLRLNQEVQVKITDVDVARKRISLTMKF
jgi:uncharacterized protein